MRSRTMSRRRHAVGATRRVKCGVFADVESSEFSLLMRVQLEIRPQSLRRVGTHRALLLTPISRR